jgi:hypothetical protein
MGWINAIGQSVGFPAFLPSRRLGSGMHVGCRDDEVSGWFGISPPRQGLV